MQEKFCKIAGDTFVISCGGKIERTRISPIGNAVFIINSIFDTTSKSTAEQTLKKLIEREAEKNS